MSKKVPGSNMQIPDLSYLQCVPEDELILGSAGVSVISEASASGLDSYIFASAKSTAISVSNDVSTASGIGLSSAFGDNTTAKVTVEGDGDIVIKKTQSKFSKNTALASGFVIAIDFPYNLIFP